MKIEDQIYSFICGLFAALIVTGNLIYQKFIVLDFLPFHRFELSVAALLYPLVFLLTDLITEFFGKEKANFCVKMGLTINIIIALTVGIMDHLPATEWSKIDNKLFHKVFGLYSVAFISSVIACYIAQKLDITLYLWIRNLTKGKYLWLRNNGSTAISLFVDTFIVIVFMTAFGALPAEQMWTLIYNSYVFKLFFTISSTPIFYGMVSILGRLISKS